MPTSLPLVRMGKHQKTAPRKVPLFELSPASGQHGPRSIVPMIIFLLGLVDGMEVTRTATASARLGSTSVASVTVSSLSCTLGGRFAAVRFRTTVLSAYLRPVTQTSPASATVRVQRLTPVSVSSAPVTVRLPTTAGALKVTR